MTPLARADIFEWEYINPADASLGKQQSTTLAPDGAGVNAGPGANLSSRNLTMAYLIGADLSGGIVSASNLTNAELSQADLTNVNFGRSYDDGSAFERANLTGANLTGATILGARFDEGITLSQLYSTASYQAHDMSGIGLYGADLSGANFAGQNLTGATLMTATLTGANFTGATVRGASVWLINKAQLYSTASYEAKNLGPIILFSTEDAWNFVGHDLTGADLRGTLSNADFNQANLTNARFSHGTLANANLSHANLTDALLDFTNLTGANLTGAEVHGANFSSDSHFYPGSGLTLAQLYSTASYQAHDLTGMNLRGNDLTGANLTGQNLSDVNLTGAELTGAILSGADVRDAQFHRDISRNKGGISVDQLYSTGSYQAHDLSGIGLGGSNLAGANLAGQNLADAIFDDYLGADLSGADLSQADLTNAYLGTSTLANATLIRANLAHVDLHLTTLVDANLSQANLTHANLAGDFVVVPGEEGGYYHFPGTDLSGANLTGANLTNADFSGTEDYVFGFPHPGANLTNANLSGADARGANFQYATLTGAGTANLIQSDGHIGGLGLTAGASLVIHDYDGNPAASPPTGPLPIVIEEHLVMDPTGTLQLVFEADPWDSLISFQPGIPVSLGGTLELAFASGVDVATQGGRTFDLFDWTGVTPTGQFHVASSYEWDLTELYGTGQVTLLAAVGLPDYNGNGLVDQGDLDLVLANWGSLISDPVASGWINAPPSGIVDQGELDGVLANWGQSAAVLAIPEPTSLTLLAFAVLLVWCHALRGAVGFRGACR